MAPYAGSSLGARGVLPLLLGRARTYAGLMSGMPGGDVILQHSETNPCGKAKTGSLVSTERQKTKFSTVPGAGPLKPGRRGPRIPWANSLRYTFEPRARPICRSALWVRAGWRPTCRQAWALARPARSIFHRISITPSTGSRISRKPSVWSSLPFGPGNFLQAC